MSSSFPKVKVKGFKKDKRNLIESTNNLVVFGYAPTPQEVTGSKGRRLLRRGGLRQHRSSRPKSIFPPGPCSTTEKLDKLVQRINLTNYFANTKPWNDPSNKKPSSNQHDTGPMDSAAEINLVETVAALGDGGSTSGALAQSSLQLSQLQKASVITSEGTPDTLTPAVSFVNKIVCPVCLKGFEPMTYSNVPVADIMKHSLVAYQQQNDNIFKKNLEDGWGASAKPKCQVEPQDVVVAGNCGELFHRLCLRDWCARGHRKSPRSSKPVANCPSCNKELKYTMCQEIEILRCFTRDHTMLHKEFIKVKHVNKELQILWPETNNYLAKIKREIQDTETLYDELRSKRRCVKSELKKLTTDDLSIVMAKVTDINTVKSSLAKQEKALEFMQQETLQIMRMYLLTILRKLKASAIPVPSLGNLSSIPEFPSLIGKIPPSLVPYLQDIVNDNEALIMLSRILAPFRDDVWDESQQKYLELALIQKFAAASSRSPPNLTRPNTYVVSSSAPEVGDSDSDDVMVKRASSVSSIEEKAIIPVSSLKASTATHEIPTIPSHSKPRNILRAGTLSNLTVACKDKPPRLIEVLEIEESNSTIDSGLLEEKLMGLDFSPNGGGSVDRTYAVDPTSPSLSSSSSVQYALNSMDMDDSGLLRLSKESLASSMFSGSNSMSLHHYEQDSKYVRAIRQLMKQSKAPPATPQTVLATSENSVAHSSTTKAPHVEEIVKIHTGYIGDGLGSEQPSSNNSETNQLNEMLIAFMRRQQNLRLDFKLIESKSVFDSFNDEDENVRNVDNNTALVPEPPPPPPPPNNSEGSSYGSVATDKTNETKIEDSLANSSPDDDYASSSENSQSQEVPLPADAKLSNQSTCNNNPKLLDSNESCDPIYTDGYQMCSPPEGAQSDYGSVADAATSVATPRKDEISISIMYVIEECDEDETDDESDSESGLKKEDHVDKNSTSLLPLPLPTKVLSPIYLTAEKTSNYSIVANESEPAVVGPKKSPTDYFNPIIWPRPSRMIPADEPSNMKINCSHSDINNSTFYSCCNTGHHQTNSNNMLNKRRNSLMTLPPLPEEMAQRKSESVVPTLFYENEKGTTNCNNNKVISKD